MKKYTENDRELLSMLLVMQEDTSPISLSIGYTSGEIVKNGIVLHKAPPCVIDSIIEEGYRCNLTEYGMHVYKL